MFTIPAGGGGIILVARPSASSGTITSAAQAYDLPSSRADDPPYSTSADRATVTGSAVAGTVDYDVVEFNTFPSRSKTNFSKCSLVIASSSILNATAVSVTGTGPFTTAYVTPSLSVDYQIDGSTWATIKLYDFKVQTGPKTFNSLGAAANSTNSTASGSGTPGIVETTTVTKETISIDIPASSFPSNLNSLKVRFRLGTCTNNSVTTYKSSGSYSVWDIRANIS